MIIIIFTRKNSPNNNIHVMPIQLSLLWGFKCTILLAQEDRNIHCPIFCVQMTQNPLRNTPKLLLISSTLTYFRNPNKKLIFRRMSDNIPFDIQKEIIKRVSDVKSLIRFRAVSKPWKSYIESSKFITGYGVRNPHPHRLLLRYKDNADEVKYVSFVDGENNILTQQQNFAPNVTDLVKQLKEVTAFGSSCGLWFLHGYNTSDTEEIVVIWNPSIGKSVGIVVPCELKNTLEILTCFGAGVCPSTYDPTIVGISWCLRESKLKVVGILTLSSNTWKMIPTNNMPRGTITLMPATQVAIDRFIFWVAFDRVVNLILSFDLITHEFKEVYLPFSIAVVSADISISELNESLVVSAYTYEVNRVVYSVWMMGQEGGVMTYFTKLFNIKTPDDPWFISKVLGFTMSGEPIIETESDDAEFVKVAVYKPCSEHINDLRINGNTGSFFVCPYTETLLLIDHSDCIIGSNYSILAS